MKKILSLLSTGIIVAALFFVALGSSKSFVVHAATDPCVSADTASGFKDRVSDTLNCIRPDNAPDLGTGTAGSANRLDNKTKTEKDTGGLRYILTLITGLLASTAGIYGLIMMLKHAYDYVSAKGADDKMLAARKGMVNTLLGIIGVIFAYSFVTSLITLIYDQISKAG